MASEEELRDSDHGGLPDLGGRVSVIAFAVSILIEV